MLATLGLAAPFVLAFFSGGYFAEARDWAGAVAWILVGLSLLVGSSRLPRHPGALLTLGGLALYAAWTGLSMLWAPSVDSAYGYLQIAVLYLGALVLAARLLGGPRAGLAEPVLAAGCAVVVGYGLAERLLPGLLHFSRSISAQGRLDQPLTYWNAMGELAAIGFILAARVAADPRRSSLLRGLAAALAPGLALGVYLSFSRGALFATAAGLLSLVILARTRGQLRIALTVLAGAVVVSAVAAPMSGVTSLGGGMGSREAQGAAMLLVLAAVSGLCAWIALRGGGHGADLERELPLPRRAGRLTFALVCGMLAVAIIAGAKEGSGHPLSGGASRLETLKSNRYAYWSVALHAFAERPLQGVGAGGWAAEWLRRRHVNEFAKDAHSLPLQTMAELGLVGLGLLAMFLAGAAVAARRGLALDRAGAAGLIAGLVTWLAHQPLDWDWEMPALTLVAMALAGGILAVGAPAGGASGAQ